MLTICFTGHRPNSLSGYDHDKYVPFVEDLSKRLKTFCKGEPITFITGGAQGFDQLAFWAVDKLRRDMPPEEKEKIENEVYIPFPGQQDIWRKDGLFGQNQYDTMLRNATRTKYCRSDKPAIKRDINDALINRNHRMVDASDIVIALCEFERWDNLETRGGTAECMLYAKTKNKLICHIKYRKNDLGMLQIKTIEQHDFSRNPELAEKSQEFQDMP